MSPHVLPCRALTPARWAAMRENAIAFCERFGDDAHRLGWTAPQLFALHPKHGTARPEAYGAMMIEAGAARGVEHDRILFARTAGYRNGPGQEWGVSVWEYGRKGAGTVSTSR